MIFDAEFRRRLEVLKRIVSRALAGRGGAGRSAVRERGGRVEFAGHRVYASGDDVRAVDWNAYARLEALVVKEFEAPREGHLLLVLDRSGSMGCFGKDETALRMAAALGWLGLASGARVACVSRAAASPWITAQARFPELLEALEQLPSGGVADLPAAVQRARAPGSGPRTAMVFSDLYETAPAARALAALRRKSRRVQCVQVLAREELTPPPASALVLRDAETDASARVRLDSRIRARFRERVDAFLEERRSLVSRHGARLCRVLVGEDLIAAVERVILEDGRK